MLFSKWCKYRSSQRGCSVKNDVLKNFAKFTGKHLCWSLFFNSTFFTEHHRATASVNRYEFSIDYTGSKPFSGISMQWIKYEFSELLLHLRREPESPRLAFLFKLILSLGSIFEWQSKIVIIFCKNHLLYRNIVWKVRWGPYFPLKLVIYKV